MNNKIRYLIWSIERRSWCASDTKGYTFVLGQAGRYSHDQALKIITDGNKNGDQYECIIAPECNSLLDNDQDPTHIAK